MSEGMKDSLIQNGCIFVDSENNMDEKLKDNLQSIGIIFKEVIIWNLDYKGMKAKNSKIY